MSARGSTSKSIRSRATHAARSTRTRAAPACRARDPLGTERARARALERRRQDGHRVLWPLPALHRSGGERVLPGAGLPVRPGQRRTRGVDRAGETRADLQSAGALGRRGAVPRRAAADRRLVDDLRLPDRPRRRNAAGRRRAGARDARSRDAAADTCARAAARRAGAAAVNAIGAWLGGFWEFFARWFTRPPGDGSMRGAAFVRYAGADGLGHVGWAFDYDAADVNAGSVENPSGAPSSDPADMGYWDAFVVNPIPTMAAKGYNSLKY